jgi:hypothetical protein
LGDNWGLPVADGDLAGHGGGNQGDAADFFSASPRLLPLQL